MYGSVANDGIAFTVAGGTLVIGGTKMPNAIIGGFAQNDTIDLPDVKFDHSGNDAVVKSGNLLHIVESGHTYDLQLDPTQSFAGEFSHFLRIGLTAPR